MLALEGARPRRGRERALALVVEIDRRVRWLALDDDQAADLHVAEILDLLRRARGWRRRRTALAGRRRCGARRRRRLEPLDLILEDADRLLDLGLVGRLWIGGQIGAIGIDRLLVGVDVGCLLALHVKAGADVVEELRECARGVRVLKSARGLVVFALQIIQLSLIECSLRFLERIGCLGVRGRYRERADRHPNHEHGA